MGAMPFPSSPFPLVPSLTCSLSSPESPQEHPWSSPSPLPFPRLPSAPPAGETRDSVTGLSLLRRPSSPSPRSARLQRSRGISAASSRCSFHLQRARCILLAHAWPRHRTPADNSSIAARQVRAPAPIWTGSPLLRRLAAESAPFRPVPADPAARNPPVVVFSIAMVLLFLFFRNESTSVSLVPSVDRASSGLQGPARPSCSLPSNRVKAHVVRIQSTTSVCLLHGLVLLPCGISGKMTIPSKSLLSLLASCSLYCFAALPTTCYIMPPILPCQASNPPFLASRCLAILPLCSAPLIALLVAGED
ncbi:uncharacterized protein [Aegilops tauschii subsp. strangulata]|uniref:uncharacterized protein n=1 Tax=Aegilops tauschii subsp. strangulata TaxID=200361 RepID=UPI003CC8DC71